MCIQFLVSFLLCATAASLPHNFHVKRAFVELVPGGDSAVRGTITLIQGPGHVRIIGRIFGLKPGPHGFHVHMNGDTGDSCKAAGGHFNPDMNEHSAPTSGLRHAGDLGNIMTPANSHITGFELIDEVITLGDGGVRDIANRAIVVHAGEDDLGQGIGEKAAGSKKTGNAGGRVACGIIKLLN
eukprot:TRINITY_DN35141_c0_g1_i1.p1 TRINITY_DN35141_c0_g1~~TRINITY_DN35141_c0_g1_i1.p1  ORF type:complete len:183 (-),score=39.50 TRINITY_DN35141_c0_g1_i1:86-634(-)